MSNADKFKQMSKGLDLPQAFFEADRCLLCHDAPCSEGCPADTRPADFIRKLRLKNITGAIRTIKENNILGGACGVLCPTARLCEEKCSAVFKSENRPEGADRPIQIGRIALLATLHHAVSAGGERTRAARRVQGTVRATGQATSIVADVLAGHAPEFCLVTLLSRV